MEVERPNDYAVRIFFPFITYRKAYKVYVPSCFIKEADAQAEEVHL